MGKSLRVAYAESLVEAAETNDKIVCFDCDLANATQTILFKQKFPDRFFDLGIAEANMMCIAASFASTGYIPFVSTFVIFGAGRAYEMIRNSICYENLNVKFGLTHAGLSVGEDGGSHQSIEDIALMRVLPNMTILCPVDEIEMKKAVNAAIKTNGPVYIRASRPNQEIFTEENTPFVVGKANVIKEGKDVTIITFGLMMNEVLKASEELLKNNISTTIINMHTIKPIDKEIIKKYGNTSKLLLTVEEHSIIGGLGSAVAEVLAEENINVKFKRIGINDLFGQSGSPKELFEEYGLTSEHIIEEVKKNI